MASREVAKREKRKIFSKKKEPLLMKLASSLANNSQAPPGYLVESQRLVFWWNEGTSESKEPLAV